MKWPHSSATRRNSAGKRKSKNYSYCPGKPGKARWKMDKRYDKHYVSEFTRFIDHYLADHP